MDKNKYETYLKKQLFIMLFISIGSMLIGYSSGWSAPVIIKLKHPEQTPFTEVITEEESSWVGSVIYIGIIAGSFISGYLSNIKGRKSCLYLGCIISFTSYILLAVPRSILMIYFARITLGIGLGLISVTHIVSIGEIASANIRGAFLSSTGFSENIGMMVMYAIGPQVSYSATGYVAICLATVYVAGVHFYIPESPIYLVLQGREREVRQVLTDLGRTNEIDKILSLKLDDDLKTSSLEWSKLFSVKSNRRALFITLSITIFQQFSGISVIIFFSTSIFEMARDLIDPGTSTIIIGVTQTLTSLVTPILMEYCGRRLLLLISTLFCSFSMALLGVFFYLHSVEHPVVSQILWLPLFSVLAFLISFNLGLNVVPDILSGELFQPSDRTTGSAITMSIGWTLGFIVSTTFGYLLKILGGHMTFWMYSGACASAFGFTAIFVPETKGKTLFEIQKMMCK